MTFETVIQSIASIGILPSMSGQAIVNVVLLMLAASLGFNLVFWSMIGLFRLVAEKSARTAAPRRLMQVKDVAVVIAAHNEELPLPRCLKALIKVLPASQIYVASDGSSDGTSELLDRREGIAVVRHPVNRGYGAALISAFQHDGRAM